MSSNSKVLLPGLDVSIRLDKYKRRIDRTKRKARTDVLDWSQHNFRALSFWIPPFRDSIPRIDHDIVSREQFISRFEGPCLPGVIVGVSREWRQSWDLDEFLKRFWDEKFKVGEDDHGNNLYLPFKYFYYYCQHDGLVDDSPLYIFDSGFGSRKRGHSWSLRNKSSRELKELGVREDTAGVSSEPLASLVEDYIAPKYFTDDLFSLTSTRRPPYKWIVIGPRSSGTSIHVDPLGTSAWNTLLVGHKRWALFPPGTSSEFIDPPTSKRRADSPLRDNEAVSWFAGVLPTLTDPKSRDDSGRTLAERLGMLEILQKPGETVFIPGGWHHVVMNLDLSVAVTQNFCSHTNIEYVWLKTRFSRPKLASKLRREIEKQATRVGGIWRQTLGKIRSVEFTPALWTSSDGSGSDSTSSGSSESEHSNDDDEGVGMDIESGSVTSARDMKESCACTKKRSN